MATIGPVNLAITRLPNTPFARIVISYRIEGNTRDVATEQSYREVCELIGDDTPGDGTDDILRNIRDDTIVFGGTSVVFVRSPSLVVPLSLLDEDSGGVFPQADELRARVTLTPLLPAPSSRESNQITLNEPGIGQG